MTASNPARAEDGFEAGDWKAYNTPGHQRNFVDCVKSRDVTIAPAETAHRSITPGHLAMVSQKVGEALTWDPAEEKIVGNDAAQKQLMNLTYRGDWKLGV